MVKLNNKSKKFLIELAELLERYNVDVTGTEYSGYCGGGCDGIDFYGDDPNFRYDGETPYLESVVDIELPRCFDAKDLRKIIEEYEE